MSAVLSVASSGYGAAETTATAARDVRMESSFMVAGRLSARAVRIMAVRICSGSVDSRQWRKRNPNADKNQEVPIYTFCQTRETRRREWDYLYPHRTQGGNRQLNKTLFG